MRVIGGSARRLILKTTEGLNTRPTTDRIKETLFNILQNQIPGCHFLDLFSGSGAIGIEALSRGAASAVFVENDRQAVECIRENLANTRLEGRAKVLCSDALSALIKLEGEPFSIIFMDPPYRQGWEEKILEYLAASSLADKDTLILIEAALDTKLELPEEWGMNVVRIKEYKTNKHFFVQKENKIMVE
ncbi:16S rRNA (guanine(966)-N(2))-methyltransferase RsmD [Lachnospiraceae bacterium 62-35]